MTRHAITFFALTLAACANSPVPLDQARAVPADRIFARDLAAPCDDCGHLIVVRDTGWVSGAATYHLYVDARAVADLYGGERIDLWVKPGRHVLSVRILGSTNIPEVATVIAAGETQAFRCGSTGSDIVIQPSAW
jgi:hypothetical protein